MLDSFRELIDELLSAPTYLRDLNLGSTENPDTIPVLALLTERDLALLTRIQKTIRQDVPLLTAPPESPSLESISGTSAELFSRFESGRGEVISLLMNLTLKDWERTAISATGNEISVADDVESHVEYDEIAREQLTDLLTS